MIILAVFTDGRKDCLREALPSALANLQGPISQIVIHDDSGDPYYRHWLDSNWPAAHVIGGTERGGFGRAIRRTWEYLRRQDEPYVFHLEDDFTFNRPVTLRHLMQTLDDHPYLVQLALRRQPWNEAERAAGGIVEQHPDAYEERYSAGLFGPEYRWLEHRLFFTTNPSLYRRELCQLDWPTCAQSEGVFTHELLRVPDLRFGFWGARDSGEAVHHIGNQRVGTGY